MGSVPPRATLVLLRHGHSAANGADTVSGWLDVPLSARGCREATRAGALLAGSGCVPDVVHTSVLTRAVDTADLALAALGPPRPPVHRSWRLNERHYGALQGRSRDALRTEYGAQRYALWRRSYGHAPPPLPVGSPDDPRLDPRYAGVPDALLPRAESLADVRARLVPYWDAVIVPGLRAGMTTLVVAHGNSLRALCLHLDGLTGDEVAGLEIPTGIPLRYDLDTGLRPLVRGGVYLGGTAMHRPDGAGEAVDNGPVAVSAGRNPVPCIGMLLDRTLPAMLRKQTLEGAQPGRGSSDPAAGPPSAGAPAVPRTAHLSARNVRIEYRAPSESDSDVTLAVDNANLELQRSDFVCVVGPSGCGKTTFLNAVAGFLPIQGGSLALDGRPIPGPGPDRAMVFQQASLLPWRKVIDNVAYGLELGRTLKRKEARERARDLLDLVGLSGFADRYPAQLSGGMQQRVNLARALAVDPELLLLDEPFASIDAQTRETMQAELLRVCAARDVTALFVTHDITEAAFLGDRVCVFSPRPGHIVREIVVPFDRPRDQRLRRSPEFLALVDEIAVTLYGETGPATPEGIRR